MKRYAAHLTWQCVNRCAECWVRATVYQRPEVLHVRERTAAEWIAAAERDTPDMLELLGGEPFLFEGLYELCARANCYTAISTNCVLMDRIAAFCARPHVETVRSITCSYHPDAPHANYEWRWRRSVMLLAGAGYSVCCNLVDYPGYRERAEATLAWARKAGVQVVINPYERTEQLGELRETGLVCRGGTDHLLIAPDGTAYPCFTAFRSPYWREYELGNWIDGTVDAVRKPAPCYLDCVDYYVLPHEHSAGDMWGSRPRPVGREDACASA